MTHEFIDIDWCGRKMRIEHEWIGQGPNGRRDSPLIVFLHEGLGSLSMWRDFPARLCNELGCRGLVYSRPGYGRSTPREPSELWGPDFMHRQAHELLPALLRSLDIDGAGEQPWLFGHSDGGSIALLYAARFPERVAGVVALAPHTMVEDVTVAGIEAARQAYLQGGLRERLACHHDDPDSAFWGWNRIWLHPSFRPWSIDRDIGSVTCPLLAIQGEADEYGTLEQIRGIARRAPHAELLELPQCGHSPHRNRPEAVIAATKRFVLSRPGREARGPDTVASLGVAPVSAERPSPGGTNG